MSGTHSNLKCLVTGGCGFIGRHFSKKMSDLGYAVDIVDNMSSNSSLLPDQWPVHLKLPVFTFYQEDILTFLQKTHNQYDIIIHAGAIVGGRETIENDPLLISTNITVDNALFRWIEKNPVKYLVYFSSSAVYPINLQTADNHRKLKLADIDVSNGVIAVPDLTYGWSKLTGEFALSILSKRTDTIISVYRPFSGFGEDQHESYPFTSIKNKVLSGKPTIEIWSDAVRDFVYVDDIVNYVLLTAIRSTDKLKIMNIGTGKATSMSQLAATFAKVAGLPGVNITILNDRPKGVYYRVSEDNTDYPWTSLEDAITLVLNYDKHLIPVH